MSFYGLQGWVATWAAAGVTVVISLGGRWIARRGRLELPPLTAGACFVGWALLSLGDWREVIWPRGLLNHVLLPAGVLVALGIPGERVRSRWLGLGSAVIAACWLASAGAARPEFWRVVFGALGAAGILSWARASEASRGFAVALCMLGGMVVGGAGWLWIGAALVMVTAIFGMIGTRTRVVSPVLLMIGLVAGEVGAGRLLRGGVSAVDFSLVGALVAPWAVGRSERIVGQRFKRAAVIVGPFGAAVGVVGAAWVAYRVVRSYLGSVCAAACA